VVGDADKEMPELEHLDAVARDLQAAEFGSLRAVAGEAALELIEGSGPDHRELPGVAAT